MEDWLTPNSESRGFIGHQPLTLSSTDLRDRVSGGNPQIGGDVRTRTTEVGLAAFAELALSALSGIERDDVIALTTKISLSTTGRTNAPRWNERQ